MTTETQQFVLTSLPKTDAAIRAEFPGKANAGLRKKLRDSAYGGSVSSCSDVALTASGRASLDEVHRVHREEMRSLGLVDSEGCPKYQSDHDEHGRTVFFLDQPTPTYGD